MEGLNALSNEEVATELANFIQRRGILTLVLSKLNFDSTVVIEVVNDSAASIAHRPAHVNVIMKNLEEGEEFYSCSTCSAHEFEKTIGVCVYPTCQNFVCRECHVCTEHDSEE